MENDLSKLENEIEEIVNHNTAIIQRIEDMKSKNTAFKKVFFEISISEQNNNSNKSEPYKLVVNQTIFSSVRLSASIENEDSRFIKTNSDLLLPNSFHYREYQSFISNSDTTKTNYQLKYIRITLF